MENFLSPFRLSYILIIFKISTYNVPINNWSYIINFNALFGEVIAIFMIVKKKKLTTHWFVDFSENQHVGLMDWAMQMLSFG
jgi:hypothetical protein